MVRILAAAFLLVGCSDGYSVVVRFEDPVRAPRASQIEVAIVDSCPADGALGEAPIAPEVTVVIREGEATDSLGDLPSGTYGLLARAVDDTCNVIAAGCSTIEVDGGASGELVVTLANIDVPLCGALFCMGGCAGSDASVDAGLADVLVDASEDAGPLDVGIDVPDTGTGCSASELLCGASCINPQSDVMNCGACDRVCDAGNICFEGDCLQDACTDTLGVPCDEVLGSYLKASNTEAEDFFGWSLSVSGDLLAVGAWREDSATTGVNGDESDNSQRSSGAVYVFRRVGTAWEQEAYLKASNADFGDAFGWSVSLSGTTLAVGARFEDGGSTGVNGPDNEDAIESSAVYVFERVAGTWLQQAYLKASNTGAGDNFGYSVSVSGDTLAVGAHLEDSAARGVDGEQDDDSSENSGAVYVFQREGSTWSQQAYLKASNTGVSDGFGYDLSLDGDTLAVGAHTEDSAASGVDGVQGDNSLLNSGAVYVFQRSATGWVQQAYLKQSTPGVRDIFGGKVSLSGDTLAVSAVEEGSDATGVDGDEANDDAIGSGAVYVFQRSGSIWSQQAYLKASNTEAADFFGWELSLSGDTLAIGAGREDSAANGVNGNQANNTAMDAGAVYLFQRSGGTWSQVTYLKPFSTGIEDNFGFGLSLSGNTLIVGAPGEDSSATGIDGNRADNSAESSGGVFTYRVAP